MWWSPLNHFKTLFAIDWHFPGWYFHLFIYNTLTSGKDLCLFCRLPWRRCQICGKPGREQRPHVTLMGRDRADPEAPQTWCFRGLLPLSCRSGSGGGMKMRPGFSRDRGLLGACAVLRFFQLSDFIRLSRKSRVALIEGNIIIQQSCCLVRGLYCSTRMSKPLFADYPTSPLTHCNSVFSGAAVNYITSAAAPGLLLDLHASHYGLHDMRKTCNMGMLNAECCTGDVTQ